MTCAASRLSSAALVLAMAWPAQAGASRPVGTPSGLLWHGLLWHGPPSGAAPDADGSAPPDAGIDDPGTSEAPASRGATKTPAPPDTTGSGEAETPSAPGEPGSGDASLTPEQLHEREQEFNFAEAKRHFHEGQRLYQAGRYPEAAVEFERSYAALPAANALYNAALSYERAGKAVDAVRALQRYLALPDCGALPAEQRTLECTSQRPEAQQALEQQRRRVGELTLKNPEGVELREVRVAGRTIPLDDFPLLLMPGTVDVELFGMGPEDRRTRPAYITAGEVYEVYVAPWKSEASPVPPPPEVGPEVDDPPRLEQRQRRLKIAFWTGVGLTAASGVALGVMGGLARYHQRRFNTEKCDPYCGETNEDGEPIFDENGDPIPLDRPYPFDHRRAFERYKPVANALVGVTVGLAVGTALVGAFAFRKRKVEQGPSETARVRVRMGAPGLLVRW